MIFLTANFTGMILSVLLTMPYLKARSLGGSLMTLGHLVFASHFILVLLRMGPVSEIPPKLMQGIFSSKSDAPASEVSS